MNQHLWPATGAIVPLALGLWLAVRGTGLPESPPQAALTDLPHANALLHDCQARQRVPAAGAATGQGRTQWPLWLQQQQAAIERCLRDELAASESTRRMGIAEVQQ